MDLPGLTDLHRHLDGSLRLDTLRDLSDEPFSSKDLLFTRGMGLPSALAKFAFVLRQLRTPDRVQRVASEICEDAEAEGITTLEIRFGPHLHTGARPEAIVDAALEGVNGRAGLILCGLYGDDPAILEHWVDIALTRPGVVAIDLAGGPQIGQGLFMAPYATAFKRAAEAGIGRTAHAGEGRSPDEMRQAIEVLGVQRIGHGTTLLDDPAVLELVLKRDIVIEACPTSNMQTSAINSVAEHPLAKWLDLGVKATVCTDNTMFSAISSVDELQNIRAIPGLTEAGIQTTIATGHQAAFRR